MLLPLRHKFSTILASFAMLTFKFKTLVKFCVCYVLLCVYIMGYHRYKPIIFHAYLLTTATSKQQSLSSVSKVAVVERFDCISVEEFRIFRSNIVSIDNCSFAIVIMNIFNGLRLEVLWGGPQNVRDGRREGIGRIFWDLNGVGVVKEG